MEHVQYMYNVWGFYRRRMCQCEECFVFLEADCIHALTVLAKLSECTLVQGVTTIHRIVVYIHGQGGYGTCSNLAALNM